jgi:enoyl-CoA hydratase
MTRRHSRAYALRMESVSFEIHDRVAVVTIERPHVRNAVDQATAAELAAAFRRFDDEEDLSVGILTGAGETFCAGADLKEIASGDRTVAAHDEDGPMGPTRMFLNKPVIAAIEGHAVAGGLELALWCDLRVAAEDAILGVFCRRVGVPLIDLGTVRLPRLIGQGRALDLILTGRGVPAPEAHAMGLVDRLSPPGGALARALELASEIAAHPQTCMRNDRRSVLEQWSLSWDEAIANEFTLGLESLASGEGTAGARGFIEGDGR